MVHSISPLDVHGEGRRGKDVLAKDVFPKFTSDARLLVTTERHVGVKLVDAINLSRISITTQLITRITTNPCSSGAELVCSLKCAVDVLTKDSSSQTIHCTVTMTKYVTFELDLPRAKICLPVSLACLMTSNMR
jgi:hypothetical protein